MAMRLVDAGFTLIFLGEMLLKVVGLGLVLHPGSYLRSPWNVLDCIAVLASVGTLSNALAVGFFSDAADNGGVVAALRAARVLRPLRTLARVPALKKLVRGLFGALPAVFNATVLLAIVVFVFGVAGVQLWMGAVNQRCFAVAATPAAIASQGHQAEPLRGGQSVTPPATGTPEDLVTAAVAGDTAALEVAQQFYFATPLLRADLKDESCGSGYECPADSTVTTECIANAAAAGQKPFTFDDFLQGALLVLKIVTFDNWPDDHAAAMRYGGPHTATLFFLLLTMIGGYGCVNLFLAVLTEGYGTHYDGDEASDAASITAAHDMLGDDTNSAEVASETEADGADNLAADLLAGGASGDSGSDQPGEFSRNPLTNPSASGGALEELVNEEWVQVVDAAVQCTIGAELLFAADGATPGPQPDCGEDDGEASAWPPAGDRASGEEAARYAVLRGMSCWWRLWCCCCCCCFGWLRGTAAMRAIPRDEANGKDSDDGKPKSVGSADSAGPLQRGVSSSFTMGTDDADTRCAFRVLIGRFITHRAVEGTVIGVTMVAVVALAADHHGIDPTLAQVLDYVGMATSIVFAIEVTLKLVAFGPWALRHPFNALDFILVATDVLSFALTGATQVQSSYTSLRALRLLRVVRMLARFGSLQTVLDAVATAVAAIAWLLALIVLFLFVFAVLGMQLFGGEALERSSLPARPGWGNLGSASLSALIVMTGEDWTDRMAVVQRHMRGVSQGISVVYFVALFIIGNFILLNLCVAIVVDTLQSTMEANDIASGAIAFHPPLLLLPKVPPTKPEESDSGSEVGSDKKSELRSAAGVQCGADTPPSLCLAEPTVQQFPIDSIGVAAMLQKQRGSVVSTGRSSGPTSVTNSRRGSGSGTAVVLSGSRLRLSMHRPSVLRTSLIPANSRVSSSADPSPVVTGNFATAERPPGSSRKVTVMEVLAPMTATAQNTTEMALAQGVVDFHGGHQSSPSASASMSGKDIITTGKDAVMATATHTSAQLSDPPIVTFAAAHKVPDLPPLHPGALQAAKTQRSSMSVGAAMTAARAVAKLKRKAKQRRKRHHNAVPATFIDNLRGEDYTAPLHRTWLRVQALLLLLVRRDPIVAAGKTLCVFGSSNPVRQLCVSMVETPMFNAVMFVVILMNCALLAFDHANPSPTWQVVAQVTDVLFVVLFSGEIAVRVIATGCIFPKEEPIDLVDVVASPPPGEHTAVDDAVSAAACSMAVGLPRPQSPVVQPASPRTAEVSPPFSPSGPIPTSRSPQRREPQSPSTGPSKIRSFLLGESWPPPAVVLRSRMLAGHTGPRGAQPRPLEAPPADLQPEARVAAARTATATAEALGGTRVGAVRMANLGAGASAKRFEASTRSLSVCHAANGPAPASLNPTTPRASDADPHMNTSACSASRRGSALLAIPRKGGAGVPRMSILSVPASVGMPKSPESVGHTSVQRDHAIVHFDIAAGAPSETDSAPGIVVRPPPPPPAYLRDPWNVIDALVTFLSLLSLGLPVLGVSRAFRAVRLLIRVERTRVIAEATIEAAPHVLHGVLIASVIFVAISILGVQLFKGLLYHCSDETVTIKTECSGHFNATVVGPLGPLPELRERVWAPTANNFDNLINAIVSTFVLAVGDGWSEIMMNTADAADNANVAMTTTTGFGAKPFNTLFAICVFVCCNFFALNMLVGILINYFSVKKRELDGSALLTEPQKMYVRARDTIDAVVSSDPDARRLLNPVSSALFRVLTWRHRFAPFTGVPVFEHVSGLIIVINVLAVASEHWNMSDSTGFALRTVQYVCLGLFTIEVLMRLVAQGHHFFRSLWNLFDLAVVGLGYLAILLPSARSVGFLRALRLAKLLRGTSLAALLSQVGKSVGSLVNVAVVVFVTYFVFAVAGVQLFGEMPLRGFMDKHLNFRSVPAAMLILFQCGTTENWVTLMHDLGNAPESCVHGPSNRGEPIRELIFSNHGGGNLSDSCAARTYVARVYFLCFILLTSFVVLQLLVAVVVEVFTSNSDAAQDPMRDAFIVLKQRWSARFGTGDRSRAVPVDEFVTALADFPVAFTGFHEDGYTRADAIRFLTSLPIPVDSRRQVMFLDVVNALAYVKYSVDVRTMGALMGDAMAALFVGCAFSAAQAHAVDIIVAAWRQRKARKSRRSSKWTTIFSSSGQEDVELTGTLADLPTGPGLNSARVLNQSRRSESHAVSEMSGPIGSAGPRSTRESSPPNQQRPVHSSGQDAVPEGIDVPTPVHGQNEGTAMLSHSNDESSEASGMISQGAADLPIIAASPKSRKTATPTVGSPQRE